VRDRHMVTTLERLVAHCGDTAKAIVWEHNTQVGDARWTDMAGAGMVNLGQLMRERHSAEGVVLVGFGSYRGTVIASDQWGGSTQAMDLPPARHGSTEELMHTALQATPSALFVLTANHLHGPTVPGTTAPSAWCTTPAPNGGATMCPQCWAGAMTLSSGSTKRPHWSHSTACTLT
jgi:erythromycin esterase